MVWRANRVNCPPRWATRPNPKRKNRVDEYVWVAEDVLGLRVLDWMYDFWLVFSEVWVDPDNEEAGEVPYYRMAAILMGRQNGKTEGLGGTTVTHRMMMWPRAPQHVLWSAQSIGDSMDVWQNKISPRMEENADLQEAGGLKVTLGQAGAARVRLRANGSSVRLVSTGKAAGHGSSPGLVVMDEAWSEMDAAREQSLRFAQRAQPDAQFLIISTAGDLSSEYLRSVVNTGRARVENEYQGRSCYFEYSAPDEADPSLPKTWRMASPSMGHFLAESVVAQEYEDMSAGGRLAEFRRGALNQWVEAAHDPPIDLELLSNLTRPSPGLADLLYLAVDARPERDSAHIVVSDGTWVEFIESKRGMDWVEKAVKDICMNQPDILSVSVAKGSPVEALGDVLEEDGIPVVWYNIVQARKAHGAFYDACVQEQVLFHDAGIRHLRTAVAQAEMKPSGAAWVWARFDEKADIAPLVAASMAYYTAIEEALEVNTEGLFPGSTGDDSWWGASDEDWGL